MKKNIRVRVADASGNITIFVLDKFQRTQYQDIATQLLSMEALGGEQVAFVTGESSMDMCGLEFCGNASRSFALMLAEERQIEGTAKIQIQVSGCNEILGVDVDPANSYTRIKMPLPVSVIHMEHTGLEFLDGACLVDLDGIMHAVVTDIEPSEENFVLAKDYVNANYAPPAMGVMFFDSEKNFLTPVVYVRDVDTTYFEGSCGTGSTAVAAAFTTEEKSGIFQFELTQPAGMIIATIEKAHGEMKNIYIQGPIILHDVQEVAIDVPEQ